MGHRVKLLMVLKLVLVNITIVTLNESVKEIDHLYNHKASIKSNSEMNLIF